MTVSVVGVRHHSPACAGLVRHLIEKQQPHTVLIEGPADFNPRIGELGLGHQPPLAIFSYHQTENLYSRTFTPFCSYSPEWVAISTAVQGGLECRFMDLPSWTRPFDKVENRYHDEDRSREYVTHLCRKLNMTGMDELWDHLFEQPRAFYELEQMLATYFQNLRECSVASPSDLERERFMAAQIAEAARQGSVLAVCGGFHKPALEALWPTLEGPPPELPEPEGEGRFGSFLVPYSYSRLDSFTGYAAGMPSPLYYQILWEEGPKAAHRRAFQLIAGRLRERKLNVSAADLIASQAMTCGLQRLRGHEVPTRVDLLDGLAGTLIKHGLDRPLPWARRAPLAASTDPILVEMLAALAGQDEGCLAPTTPLPPLVSAVEALLRSEGLYPAKKGKEVVVKVGSTRSYLLHRLHLLPIPGFSCEEEVLGKETWFIKLLEPFFSALVEAGAYGATLPDAALSRLEELLERSNGAADQLAELLEGAFRAGLTSLPERLLGLLKRRLAAERELAVLGRAGQIFLSLWRSFQSEELVNLLKQFVDQCLWLVELQSGPRERARLDEIRAHKILADCYRLLGFDCQPLVDLMKRRVDEVEAPPAQRGSALGLLWIFDPAPDLVSRSISSLQQCSQPDRLGDFLAGLFGVARDEVVSRDEITSAVDEVVRGYSESEFFVALPALRLAFSYFPPREREAIARALLKKMGAPEDLAWSLLRTAANPLQVSANRKLEERVDLVLQRYGLS